MVDYKPSSDSITVLGQVISPQQADMLRNQIENELARREAYLESELSDEDIAVNDRAIRLLCMGDEPSEKIFVKIGFALHDAETDVIPEEYVIEWIDRWDTHGAILVQETDVQALFDETKAAFSGFHVEFDEEVLREYAEEIRDVREASEAAK